MSDPTGLSNTQRRALDEMGIDVWVSRHAPAAETESIQGASDPVAVPPDWDALEANIRACTRCELHATRTNAVCGVGKRTADVLVIGEAPGADEDRQGEPFVGRAGQLLNEMLRAIGMAREQVFIANILKCRPPNNRDPKPGEVERCWSYLQEQIELVQPKVILVVGRIAAQSLLSTDAAVGKLRGRVHEFGEQNIPVVVTYHPAYLLRSPVNKRKSWDDLLLAMDALQEAGAAPA